MQVGYGEKITEYGPGVKIDLTGAEVATAIESYLVSHGVHTRGPRTITVNGELCKSGAVYVDPTGFVMHEGNRLSGRGPESSSKKELSDINNHINSSEGKVTNEMLYSAVKQAVKDGLLPQSAEISVYLDCHEKIRRLLEVSFQTSLNKSL